MIRLDPWSCFGCCMGGARLVLLWLQSDTSILEKNSDNKPENEVVVFVCCGFHAFSFRFLTSNMLPGVYAGVMQLFVLTSLIFREAVQCLVIL